MPQRFNHAVITNAGAALLTKAQAGQCRMMFTRLLTGDGTYSEEEQTLEFLQQRDALKSGKASFAFSSIEMVSEHSVKATALITNSDPITHEVLISEGYFINEMGIYAKESDGDDSSEVLYCIVTTAGTNGDFMPPYNGYSPARIIQEFYLTVSNSMEVIINTDNSAVALAEDVQRMRGQLDFLLQLVASYGYEIDNEMVTTGLICSLDSETLVIQPEMGYVDGEMVILANGWKPSVPSGGGVSGNTAEYLLLPATPKRLGGVKIGQGLDVDSDGTISVNVDTSAEKAAALVEDNMQEFSNEEIQSLFRDGLTPSA